MIFQLLALAVAFVCVVASAWLLLRWGRAGDTTLDGHVDTALELARARHPSNRITWTCTACHQELTGPMVEHICESA